MQNLKIYDTLSNKKVVFKPYIKEKVRIYVCGMTVYDYCHIGHGRIFVMFDIIVRHLKRLYKEVIYVRNITDIDDKIIKASQAKNTDNLISYTKKYIKAMADDEKSLNIIPPTYQPKATEHIQDIIITIQKLIEKGIAYQKEYGDVYFSVKKFADYGKLSGKAIEDLLPGIRISVDEQKKNPLDFVLWKKSKDNELFWSSPFGNGRPGWHIECSAMSYSYLGDNIDIHGGGLDLIFPHHENEIAQSQCANDKKFVHNWLHIGFVSIDNEKMSKSLGNFSTIRDVLKKYSAQAIRYFLLSAHYRSPINFSHKNLITAKLAVERLYNATYILESNKDKKFIANELCFEFENLFIQALNDDFNTPLALSILFKLVKKVNDEKNTDDTVNLAYQLKKLANYLGLLNISSKDFFHSKVDLEAKLIEEKIAQRNQARIDKNYALADEIREYLEDNNIILEDTNDGVRWRYKQ